MRSDCIGGGADGNAWTSHDEGYIKVFFDRALFTRLEAVLADVVSVVCGVEDEGVIEYASFLEASHNAFYYFIDWLQRAKAVAVEMVIKLEVCLVLSWQARDPGDAAWLGMLARCQIPTMLTDLFGVEVLRPWYFYILERMLMAFG